MPALARCFVALVALGPLGRTLSSDGPAWRGEVQVRFVHDAAGARAEVEARLAWARGRGSWPETAELAMAEGYPGGYGAFVRGLAHLAPAEGQGGGREPLGAVEALDAAAGRWRVPVGDEGTLAYRYSVVLEHDPGAGLGWDETPHAFADGVLWTGRALLVAPGACELAVVLHAPAGEHVSTSLPPAEEAGRGASAARRPAPEGEAGRFGPVSEDDLRETYLLVGRHAQRELAVEGAWMLLAAGAGAAPDEQALDALAELATDLAAAAAELAGGPPPARTMLAITLVPGSAGEGGGSVYGHDAHVLAHGPPAADDPGGWRRTLAHELFHLWNPGRIRFASREMWFSEGFTDYYAHRALVAAGRLPGVAFRRAVEGWAEAYLPAAEAAPVGLREAGVLGAKNRTLVYQGGALAAFVLDVSLRRASKGKRSLDDVMAALHELTTRSEAGEVDVAELERLLARLGDRDLGGFLGRHVAGAEPLPLERALVDAGLRLRRETLAVPRREALARLLGCSGMTSTPAGLRIDRSEAGRLRPDDLLLEVGGRPIGDFDALSRALAGRAPGDELPAVVRRDGELRPLVLRLAGHGEDLPSDPTPLVLLEDDPGAKRPARAVGEALFGER